MSLRLAAWSVYAVAVWFAWPAFAQEVQDESGDEAWIAEQPSEGEPAAAPAPAAPPTAAPVPTGIFEAGIGMTQRVIQFAAPDAKRELDTGLVPALHVAIGMHFGDRLFLNALVAYDTSVWAQASQSTPETGGVPLTTTIHSHHLAGGFTPGLRFGADATSPSLGLFLGYGLRALGSTVELRIPRFTWHGPLARLELEIPLADGKLVLRVAPELHVIVAQTSDLREMARTQSSGFAFGGEASVRYRVLSWLSLGVTYRESHASIASAWSSPFEDVERYAIVDGILHFD